MSCKLAPGTTNRESTSTTCKSIDSRDGNCVAGRGFSAALQQWVGEGAAECPVPFSIGMPWHWPECCEATGGIQSRGAQSAGATSEKIAANRANPQISFGNRWNEEIRLLCCFSAPSLL